MKITKKRFNEITKLALHEAIIRIVQEELVSDDEGEAATPAVNPVPTPSTDAPLPLSPDDQAAALSQQKADEAALNAKIKNLVQGSGVEAKVAPWAFDAITATIKAAIAAAEETEGRTDSPGSDPAVPAPRGYVE